MSLVTPAMTAPIREPKALLFNGATKPFNDLAVGDVLMGPDSQPRVVMECKRSYGLLYEIVPVKGRGFYIADSQGMCFEHTGGGEERHDPNGKTTTLKGITQAYGRVQRTIPNWDGKVDVRLRDFLARSTGYLRKNPSQIWKLCRAGADFPVTPHAAVVPPAYFYYVGIWLGSGSRTSNSITTSEPDVQEWVEKFAQTYGMEYKTFYPRDKATMPNIAARQPQDKKLECGYDPEICFITLEDRKIHLIRLLSECLLDKNSGIKHTLHDRDDSSKTIPLWMLTASREQRLMLLAGLIDTDGSQSRNTFDFINIFPDLSNGVAFLARSLGLSAYVKPSEKSDQSGTAGLYWRVCITGDTDMVPTQIKRKQCGPRRQKKDVKRTGWQAIPGGDSAYNAFILNGDGRFLMDDFTVCRDFSELEPSPEDKREQEELQTIKRIFAEGGRIPVKVSRYRRLRRQGKLSEETITKLDGIGFDWDRAVVPWAEALTQMKAFAQANGHCQATIGKDGFVGTWVKRMRRCYKKGLLTQEQISEMEGIGFTWSAIKVRRGWDATFEDYYKFVQKHPASQLASLAPKLALWAYNQRQRRKEGSLSKERIAKLDSVDFDWAQLEVNSRRWEQWMSALEDFKSKRGHCRPSSRTETALYNWLYGLKQAEKRGSLPAALGARLSTLITSTKLTGTKKQRLKAMVRSQVELKIRSLKDSLVGQPP